MNSNTQRPRVRTAYAAVLALTLMIVFSMGNCAKETKTSAPATNGGAKPGASDLDLLPREYQREGFIDRDLFRIVIVSPADECPDLSYVDKNARQRAFMSLQKHLESRNKIVDNNTRARLLQLINGKGSVKNLECRDEKRKAFVFEIEMKNLVQFIDSLAAQR